jgi:hypothetical protein
MTTTPDEPVPGSGENPDGALPEPEAPGAEIGLSEDGSTFEPEEDPEAGT